MQGFFFFLVDAFISFTAMNDGPVDPRVFKSLYFVLYSSFGVIFPYFALFFESFGYSKTQIGILCCIPNLTSLLVAPFINSFSDYYGISFEVMILSILGNAVTIMVLYYEADILAIAYLLMFINSIIKSPLSSLVDSTVVKQVGSNFGEFRLYGAASFGIFSFFGGYLLSSNENPFRLIFFIHSAFCILGGYIITYIWQIMINFDNTTRQNESTRSTVEMTEVCTIEIESEQNKMITEQDNKAGKVNRDKNETEDDESTFSTVCRVFSDNPIVFLFIFIVLSSGIGAGVIDSFLFVHLQDDLGASGLVCGIARFITCAAEIPAFQYSGWLHKKCGTFLLLFWTQVAFVMRFTGYVLITNPYWVFPCEILNGMTFGIMWSVAVIYADKIAPARAHGTMQSILEGIHFGIGAGLGSVGGGIVYDQYSAIFCFKIAACLSSCGALTAFAVYYFGWDPQDHYDDAKIPLTNDEKQGVGQDNLGEFAQLPLNESEH